MGLQLYAWLHVADIYLPLNQVTIQEDDINKKSKLSFNDVNKLEFEFGEREEQNQSDIKMKADDANT